MKYSVTPMADSCQCMAKPPQYCKVVSLQLKLINKFKKYLVTMRLLLLFSHVQLFATPWTGACQAPLSSSISWSLLTFMSIELVMLSNDLMLCHPLILLPSMFSSIRVFSSESALYIKWWKYWSFSTSPYNYYSRLISFRTDWFDLLAVQETFRVFSNTTIWKHQFFGTQPSLWSNSHIHIWLLEKS